MRRDKHLQCHGVVMRELTRAKQDNLMEICYKLIIKQNVNKWIKLYIYQVRESWFLFLEQILKILRTIWNYKFTFKILMKFCGVGKLSFQWRPDSDKDKILPVVLVRISAPWTFLSALFSYYCHLLNAIECINFHPNSLLISLHALYH